jgi:chemotaxis protein methyltransferase CheR
MAFTFFFRDLEPLEHGVHFLLQAVSGRTRVRIWDAGCAFGPEPYTLAILLAERMNTVAFRNVELFATDHDAPLLETLKEAVYPWEQVQRIPTDLLAKYFTPAEREGDFRVVDMIRQRVQPMLHDLTSLTPIRDGLSMIVCKNVLLHLSPHERIQVIRMFHQALEPGGILLTEHTQKMPEELGPHFEQLVANSQVFRKREAAG